MHGHAGAQPSGAASTPAAGASAPPLPAAASAPEATSAAPVASPASTPATATAPPPAPPDAPAPRAVTLPRVVVTGRRADAPPADVAGFGDVPASQLPLQVQVLPAEALRAQGTQRLADLTTGQAGVADAYNAEGYWDILSVRGFVLDNRSNYRRDGLPINAETSLPLDNKAQVEVLKGLSGLQAGISAPGGLVNLVVKRPEAPLRSVTLDWRQDDTRGAALDVAQRFGPGQQHGLRVNAAYQDLRPRLRNTNGHRHLLAAAADWQPTPDTTLEGEFETSRRVQPSQAAFSLLGNQVPPPADPRLNLNNQPWSQPVVFDADTASLRWQHRLAGGWQAGVHAATQRLRTDDRIAFAFGCSAENAFDRFCSDGSFDVYDFRSENERRHADALDTWAQGQVEAGAFTHHLRAGMLLSRATAVLPPQAFNSAGTGTIDGTAVTPPEPTLSGSTTTRRERSAEAYLRGRTQWEPLSQLFWGLRHTRLSRSGGEADYRQSFTTPWLAYTRDLSPQWGAGWLAYGSWGQGIETAVAPALPHYTNAGAPLPALRSRQLEAGLRHTAANWSATLAAFQITRPQTTDIGACNPDPDDDPDTPPPLNCTRTLDGTQRHTGLEAQADARTGAWSYGASVTTLSATRRGSADASLNGRRPPNVPEHTVRAHLGHTPTALPGLNVSAHLAWDGDRTLLPGDETLRIPAWSRLDLRVSYEQTRDDGRTVTWRGGIDNLTDKRAWKESPFQFGHAYLYPMAPRTLWVGLETRL